MDVWFYVLIIVAITLVASDRAAYEHYFSRKPPKIIQNILYSALRHSPFHQGYPLVVPKTYKV